MSSKAEILDSDLGLETGKPAESHVEALRRQQAHTDIDPQLDKRLDRKFDLRIMPWLFGIWYTTLSCIVLSPLTACLLT
jgi:hypothetical protein